MIIGICGKKQSGKNTVSNILHGLTLLEQRMVSDFNIDSEGRLWIETKDSQENVGWGEFDVTRTDDEFYNWAEHNMYPFVKNYSFADSLKIICHNLFGLTKEQCWGTDAQKNTIVPHLLWENMPGVTTEKTPQYPVDKVAADNLVKYYEKVLNGVVYHKPGQMTAREFLQFFGTEICRKMYAPVWVNATINKIKNEGSLLSIVSDVRFPDEADAIKAAGGKLIKLTRAVFSDGHSSETSLDNYTNYDYIIDNSGDSTLEKLIEDIKKVYKEI